MTNSIYATFSDPAMAQKAVGALLDNGVRNENITAVFPEGYTAWNDEKGHEKDAVDSAKTGISTTTAADAEAGAAKGAGIGLAAGAAAALVSLFIPGIGLVIGGGALALAIGGAAGATAAGAVSGGLTGYLKDQGVNEEDVQHYTTVVGGGGSLITVSPTDENIQLYQVEEILVKYGASITSRTADTNRVSLI